MCKQEGHWAYTCPQQSGQNTHSNIRARCYGGGIGGEWLCMPVATYACAGTGPEASGLLARGRNGGGGIDI